MDIQEEKEGHSSITYWEIKDKGGDKKVESKVKVDSDYQPLTV